MWESRQAHLDVLFGGFLALAMAALTRALEPGRGRWLVLGLFLAGFAILVKGPLALVAVASFALAAVLLGRPRAFFNAALAPGILMMLLPGLFWLGWACLHLNGVREGAGFDYVRSLFQDQIVDRARSGRAHVREGLAGWLYYFQELPLGLLPFFPVVLSAFSGSVRRSLAGMRPAFVVAACWIVVSFLVQSAFPGKRGLYLVPLAAPFGVLCAAVVHSASRGALAFASGWATLVACAVFVASGVLVAAGVDDWLYEQGRVFASERIGGRLAAPAELPLAGSRPADGAGEDRAAALDWPGIRRGALISGIAGAVLAAIALTALALGAIRAGVNWTAVAVAVPAGLALGLVLPHFDPLISRTPAAEAARAAADAGGGRGPLAFFRHLDEAFPFYVGRPVPDLTGVRKAATDEERARDLAIGNAFLTQPGAVLIVRRSDLVNLWARGGDTRPLQALGEGRVTGPYQAGGQNFYLLKGPR
jgi:4-amino-4-deoxy-L-arabinose transferase-like glycosyltransferase